MEITNKRRAVSLGARVGVIFLTTVLVVILIAYFVLYKNFQTMMTDYTIQLVASMTDQGVEMVETELDIGRQEVTFLAGSFAQKQKQGAEIEFPAFYSETDNLRMVYVTHNETVASDGRQLDIRARQDVVAAFAGEVAVYGPYFNEENEYVVCYTAPIKEGDTVLGVLSVEKDGYLFCRLIESIRFVDSGECYIINGQGTDIAVSDPAHIDWVNSQYNAQEIYNQQPDEETKSILELEQKGLAGESGTGTYYWRGGLCYLFYKPVSSVGWVLLAGIREEELAAMTKTAMLDAVMQSPVLGICILVVVFLTALIVFWIVSSMRETAEINQKLNTIANRDALTGLFNRNSYHNALDRYAANPEDLYACIYVDANGLHELNNFLGHQAGDEMLCAVADELRKAFVHDPVYRIGGDEFVVLCSKPAHSDPEQQCKKARDILKKLNYEISIGVCYQENGISAFSMVNKAEARMQEDKKRYYQNQGNARTSRSLDEQLEKLRVEKHDADTFLNFLAPEFQGVYFVNLSSDTIRHIYIPAYFEECLEEAKDQFSKALLLYAKRIVKPQYYPQFESLCDYPKLQQALDAGDAPEMIYQKLDGVWLRLRILKFKEYKEGQRETLWVFANMEPPQGENV